LKGTVATHGRAGVLVTDRTSLALNLDSSSFSDELPDVVRIAAANLQELAGTSLEAKQALVVLHKMLHELRAEGG
jgi:hypothetical protein